MTALAPASWWRGLGGLTRSGSSIEALAWAFYDFANTMFSFAIVGVVDRLMLLRLAPADRVGEMFGLYGLVGKFSAIIGPIIYGIIVSTLLSSLGRDAYRVAIASLFVLMLIGIWILRGVPEEEPASEDASMEAMDR